LRIQLERDKNSLSRGYKKEGAMKRCFLVFVPIILFLLAGQINAQDQDEVDFPDVKFKAGKAIIIQAGGESFERRHVMGAIPVNQLAVFKGEIELPNFPKTGVEIFTYCY
jgi:hypothetical protein